VYAVVQRAPLLRRRRLLQISRVGHKSRYTTSYSLHFVLLRSARSPLNALMSRNPIVSSLSAALHLVYVFVILYFILLGAAGIYVPHRDFAHREIHVCDVLWCARSLHDRLCLDGFILFLLFDESERGHAKTSKSQDGDPFKRILVNFRIAWEILSV
jgi:hypothetical protein